MEKEERTTKKETKWNLAKEGGWKSYKEISNSEAEKIAEVVEDENKTIEEVMKVFNKVHEKIKFKAFGKVTIKEKLITNDKTTEGKTEEEKAEILLNEQEEKADKEIKDI